MFVLDTDVISRTSPLSRVDGISRWLAEHKGRSFISVLTLAELRFGSERLRLRGHERRAAARATWLTATETAYAARLLGFDANAAHRTGELLAVAEAAGQHPGVADACIAATAAVHGFEVVAFNARHFDVFGAPHRRPSLDGAS